MGPPIQWLGVIIGLGALYDIKTVRKTMAVVTAECLHATPLQTICMLLTRNWTLHPMKSSRYKSLISKLMLSDSVEASIICFLAELVLSLYLRRIMNRQSRPSTNTIKSEPIRHINWWAIFFV